MSSSRALARTPRLAVRLDGCALCRARLLAPGGRFSHFQPPTASPPGAFRRTYAQKLQVNRLRAHVDQRARLGWYKMTRGQKILLVEPHVAEAIYNDFVAHQERKEYGKLVTQLMTKYNVSSEHLSGLALMTYSIPDLSDAAKRAMLPPSPHKANAALLLQGCADIGDPLAVKHILAAVYLSTHTAAAAPGARDLALRFPRPALAAYRTVLATLQLGGTPDPEALTLHGQFLERENRLASARAAYEKALQVPWVYAYSAQARHPAQLPVMAPWNALGYLLRGVARDAAAREQARRAFELGAAKGDDPLSYYELSLFCEPGTVDWLRCVTKAAASGHRDAMLQVALFHRRLSESAAPRPGAPAAALRSALGWLLGWREGSAARLAVEWFEAAGNAGHKAALLHLAEWHEATGRTEEARQVLDRIVEPSESGTEEEFPAVVHKAKGKLVGLGTA